MNMVKCFMKTGKYAAMMFVAVLAMDLVIQPVFAEAILTGHWTFNADGTDSIGGHNVTLVDGASFEVPSVGSAFTDGNSALRFDGDDDMATMSVDALPAGAFTLVFWEYTMDYDQAYLLATQDSGNEIFVQRRGPYGPEEVRAKVQGVYFPGIEALTNNWHQHVITNHAEGGEWYIDGVKRADMDGASLWNGGSDPLCIGNRPSDQARGLNGYIDDLQIYTGVVNEVQANWLYQNPGDTLPVPEPQMMVMLLSLLALFSPWRRSR